MRWKLFLFALVVNLCCEVLGQIEKRDDKNQETVSTDGNQDETKDILKPCDENNIECIRHFFATYGHCMTKHGPLNGPGDQRIQGPEDHRAYSEQKGSDDVYRERQILYLPHFGITITLTDSKIRGLDGKIDKFYVNKRTNNLIMSVRFKEIVLESKNAYFQYHRLGQEPIVTHDYVNVTYSVILTAVIPIYTEISLKEATVAFHSLSCDRDYIGTAIKYDKDPDIGNLYDALVADKKTACQEAFLTEGPSLFFAYLQNYICDFGIPISA